jgi:predicted nuclease with TOPRIM domain
MNEAIYISIIVAISGITLGAFKLLYNNLIKHMDQSLEGQARKIDEIIKTVGELKNNWSRHEEEYASLYRQMGDLRLKYEKLEDRLRIAEQILSKLIVRRNYSTNSDEIITP